MNAPTITHIVDGGSALDHLRLAGYSGAIINWLDVLHDGPVSGGPDWDGHVRQRAAYLASLGWTSAEAARRDLAARYEQLEASRDTERVIWLAAELFDQLQLLELLAYLRDTHHDLSRVSLVGLPHSVPLTSADDLAVRYAARQPLQPTQVQLAGQAWEAFTGTDPNRLADLLAVDLTPLPYLGAALLRLCREFPHQSHGLSHSQYLALQLVAGGPMTPGRLFRAITDREPVPFMGDASFWWRLQAMCAGPAPLLAAHHGTFAYGDLERFLATRLVVTAQGERVLAGQAHWTEQAPIQIGGCDLGARRWCWHERDRRFC